MMVIAVRDLPSATALLRLPATLPAGPFRLTPPARIGRSMAQQDTAAIRRSPADLLLVVLLSGISPAFLIAVSIAEPYAGKDLKLPADEVIWFAESFLIGTLAVMPLSGTLITKLGFVRLVRVALAGSLAAGCGLLICDKVVDLSSQGPVMILLLLAGIFSAPLAPAAQAFAVATHPPEQRGKAMALWGGGRFFGFLMTAVLAGPLIAMLGWSFPILVGAAMAVPCFALLRQPDRLPLDRSLLLDVTGLLLLLLALLPLLMVLNLISLFSSPQAHLWLIALLLITLAGGWFFVRHVGRCRVPIVSLHPLGYRDFRIATFIAFAVALMTTGQFSILMLGEFSKISSDWLSWRTALGGIAQVLGVIAGGYLVRPLIARPAACLALVVTALGLASFNLYGATVDLATISATRALMGFGLGLTVPLLAAFAYSGLREDDTPAASSLFVFAGMMGTGIGVAALGGEFTEAHILIDNTLASYRVVFWTQVIAVVALIPLVWMLRLDDLRTTRR